MLAVDENQLMSRIKFGILTAHRRGLPEDLGDLRVHLDHQVLLDRHLGVAVLNLLLDPFIEDLSQHGSNYVAYPLLGGLGYFELRFRQIFVDILMMIGQELEDLFDP